MSGPALPARKPREYEVEDREYSIKEIAELLEDSIPFTVVVSKGYVNKALANKGLETNKVYRVNCVSRSSRILASLKHGDGPPTYYSIPDSYYINMARVDRKGQQIGQRLSVYQLLSDNKIPFQARFITDAFAKHGGRALFTSHIPPLTFVRTFEEVHLLLNNIPNVHKYDEIDDDILYVPQFYSKIRFKRVTGINVVRNSDFLKMEQAINTASGSMEFDMQYGALEIDEFWPHKYDTNIVYTNKEPMRCGIIPDLFPKHTPKLPTPVYEQLSKEPADGGYCSINDVQVGNKSRSSDYTNDIPRGPVKPTLRVGQGQSSMATTHAHAIHTSDAGVKRTSSETTVTKQLPPVEKAEDIKSLSIDEVCGYMNVLKLGRYAPMFRDQLVDGMVLCDLGKEILTKEFGFTAFDAIKLMHFIRDGHVPS